MIIKFKNAVVEDNGYNMRVNGEYLSEIISTALGTRVDNEAHLTNKQIPEFYSNSCDLTIIINKNLNTERIESALGCWDSVADMMKERYEAFGKSNQKDPAENSEG